jgi:signal recognition particle subunit SRP54
MKGGLPVAFDTLSTKLQEVFKRLRGKGRLTEKDVAAALREVKLALLEADVNFRVVKDFVAAISGRAAGQDVLEGLNPGQQVIKIVHEELIQLLGGTDSHLTYAAKPPTVIMVAGLQGAGKTTFCGKLAGLLRRQGKRPLLAACDVYRPAAIKQLQVVGGTYGIPVYTETSQDPVAIAENSLAQARENGHDLVILDTAGRLHIDDAMMEELKRIKARVRPQEILLVLDAMTGQDAVSVAEHFNGGLGVDGVVLSKLDGDTRGGAALSVRHVTGKPIKFASLGEKLEDLEVFHPDRMASRILGMGDVLSLIEKAEQAIDMKQALEMEKKLRANAFTLQDFLTNLQQVRKMGPLKNLLGMMPGLGQMNIDESQIDEGSFKHVEAIIQSMTPAERDDPDILNGSRKRRVARGSGRSIQEINRLLKQFEEMKKMMKQLTDFSRGKKGKLPFPLGR